MEISFPSTNASIMLCQWTIRLECSLYVYPLFLFRVGTGSPSFLPEDSSCRIDELAKAMWESTSIARFAWISPEQLYTALRRRQVRA